jgi:hypothetical protein
VEKSAYASIVVWLMVVSLLTACAGPEPVLRSNKQLQLYGKEKARQEIEVCLKNVEDGGLRPGVHQSANAATGAVLGVTLGGAVGASAGIVGGLLGVTIGAAAGASIGMIIGLAGGTFKPLVPDPPFADAVAKCLKEKGYEVSSWE